MIVQTPIPAATQPIDRRAYQFYATTEAFQGFQKIQVDFGPPPNPERERPPDDDTPGR
ncbi:hypothetical protein RKE30_20160 [Streptomyces sp. Li-HN-5-11]|uniref:hypothetical protein n=1 Tax=Streptomyces sp. Li-HN-5-11 TaxID=3075432 RepID=UPI0028A79F47|nr:hypothetical protein [Streptomyces sp. Li-HN-5-11]WNM32563.1 hypothetical protein RKE30_20160 [Streptomyces sp. Li-HN-5-11]